MKFIQFTYKNNPDQIRLGYVEDDCVMDVQTQDREMPNTMLEFLKNDYYWKRIKDLKQRRPQCVVPLGKINLKAPIHGMDKVLCVATNYEDLCRRHRLPTPSGPIFFNKFPSTVTGPDDPVLVRTNITKKVDYEVELAVVIGYTASNVKAKDAYDHVFGYTIAQDISARDWQKDIDKNRGEFLLGKSMDTFCPIGPWIVTFDEIEDVNNLKLTCSVNGVSKQWSNTCFFLSKIPEIIERISSFMTLLPGDLILTGSPSGSAVYAGGQYLKPGDIICSEIDGIGCLQTRIAEFIPQYKEPKHKEILWPY